MEGTFSVAATATATAIGDDFNLSHKKVLRHMPEPPWL